MTEIMFSGTGVKVDKCNFISLKCSSGVFLKCILFRKQLMLVVKKVSEYDLEISKSCTVNKHTELRERELENNNIYKTSGGQ